MNSGELVQLEVGEDDEDNEDNEENDEDSDDDDSEGGDQADEDEDDGEDDYGYASAWPTTSRLFMVRTLVFRRWKWK